MGKNMENEIIEKILSGASLRCVMRPDDEIPTNRPLHDECFDLPHVIINGEEFCAITSREIVTKPGVELPIVFYYTHNGLFGSFSPVEVEAGLVGPKDVLWVSLAPRKRYRKFEWLVRGAYKKIWDSMNMRDIEPVRQAVLRGASLKVAFLDEEEIWNIHPVILPQVACNEKAFLLQTNFIAYPFFIRNIQVLEGYIDSEGWREYIDGDKLCFTEGRRFKDLPFQAFYHLRNDGTYKSYYDLARGDTVNSYKHLMVFADE